MSDEATPAPAPAPAAPRPTGEILSEMQAARERLYAAAKADRPAVAAMIDALLDEFNAAKARDFRDQR